MYPEGQVYREVTLADLKTVAQQLLTKAGTCKVWLFFGELGAGKTTMIKTLGSLLGVQGTMSSPTFSIVNEYPTGNGTTIFHFDFYRIRQEEEAYDIGVDEYFYSGNYCFVEWPERIPGLIPARHVRVDITYDDIEQRTIAITVHDGEEKNRI